MFTATWKWGLTNFDEVRAVRTAVFIEEGGVSPDEEFDWFDGISAHLLVKTRSGELIAAARMYPDGGQTHIGRIAVMPVFRDQPYKEFCLRMLLFKAQSLAGEEIVVSSPVDDVVLYASFGFVPAGAPVFEHGGEHINMRVKRGEIRWHSQCKGHSAEK